MTSTHRTLRVGATLAHAPAPAATDAATAAAAAAAAARSAAAAAAASLQEFDEEPPPRWLAALDWLLSSGLSAALLAGPVLAPAAAPYAAHAAALWALLYLLLAPRAGATSPAAALLGIYATHGPYCMLAPWWRLWAAALLEAGLLLLTLGLGIGLSLACRLLTAQRQGFGERLLRLVPLREVVRPMHFSPLPPRGSSGGGGGTWSDGALSDDD